MSGHSQRFSTQVRLAMLGLVTVLVCLWSAGPAAAHDELVGATPADGAVLSAAPRTVVLEFFEDVAGADAAMVLRDDEESAITKLDLTIDGRTLAGHLPDGLADGTYSVAWSVRSDDGHTEEGVTRFAVGAPSTSLEYTGDDTVSSPSDAWSTWLVVAVGGVLVAVLLTVLVRRRAQISARPR